MQACVDWVLIIFRTQVIKKKRPVRPVLPDYLSVSYDYDQSLCPYYKVIWAKSKKLRSLGKIHSFLFRVTQLRSESAKIVPRCL